MKITIQLTLDSNQFATLYALIKSSIGMSQNMTFNKQMLPIAKKISNAFNKKSLPLNCVGKATEEE